MISAKFRRLKKIPLAFFSLVGIFILAGCWSSTEIDDLALIDVVGVDLNKTGQFEVTASVIKPEQVFLPIFDKGPEKGGQSAKALVLTAKGDSLFETVGKLSEILSEKIYLSHVNVIVFGEKLAQEKMIESLDFFKRQNDFRPNIQLYVTKGLASEMLKTKPELKPTLGLEIQSMYTTNKFSSSNQIQDLSQFLKDLSSNTTEPITGVITSAKTQGVVVEGDAGTMNSDSNNQEVAASLTPRVISVDGTAVFKDGKLKGYLSEAETRGLLLLKGDYDLGTIVMDCNEKDKGKVSLIVNRSKTKITPHLKDKLKLTVDVLIEADIGELTCSTIDLNSDKIDALNIQLQSKLKKDIQATLAKIQQEWQTDAVGFGEAIYRKEPKEWDEQISSDWAKDLFKNTPITVNVKAKIKKFGFTKDPSLENESR